MSKQRLMRVTLEWWVEHDEADDLKAEVSDLFANSQCSIYQTRAEYQELEPSPEVAEFFDWMQLPADEEGEA